MKYNIKLKFGNSQKRKKILEQLSYIKYLLYDKSGNVNVFYIPYQDKIPEILQVDIRFSNLQRDIKTDYFETIYHGNL